MVKPPVDLPSLRAFFDSIDWGRLEQEVAGEARARVAIVGPVNSGKSTLFNLLKGHTLSQVSAVPGTTKAAVVERFGPFTLVDTPGFGEAVPVAAGAESPTGAGPPDPMRAAERAKVAQSEIEQAGLVLLLLDAAAGMRQADLDLYYDIRAQGIPVLVVLNKIDLVRRDLRAILNDLSFRLQGVQVVPISARTAQGVTDKLIPAIIQSNEAVAVVVGRALPAYRSAAAKRVIDTTTWWALLLGAEPLPGLDLPLLLGMQARMVLRLAAIYGENFTAHHARELISAMAGGLAARFLGLELAKFVPGLGWVVSGIVAALGTKTMGLVAEAYFESGHGLSAEQLRQLYLRLLRRPGSKPALPLPPAP